MEETIVVMLDEIEVSVEVLFVLLGSVVKLFWVAVLACVCENVFVPDVNIELVMDIVVESVTDVDENVDPETGEDVVIWLDTELVVVAVLTVVFIILHKLLVQQKSPCNCPSKKIPFWEHCIAQPRW